MPTWPKPAKTPSTPVVDPISGKFTAGYPEAIRFVGRILDSHATSGHYQWPGTLRATRSRLVRGGDAIVFGWDWEVAYFEILRLFERFAADAPLSSIHRPSDPNGEAYLMPNSLFGRGKGEWDWPGQDAHNPLSSIDVDDRGVIYPGFGLFGWGGVTYTGEAFLRSVFQVPAGGDGPPKHVLAVRDGNEYYAAVTADNGKLYRVTTSTPALVRSLPFGITHSAKTAARVGIIDATGRIRVGDNAALLTDNWRFVSSGIANLAGIATDGETFYAVSWAWGSPTVLHILSPAGETYTHREVALAFSLQSPGISCGADLIGIFGQQQDGKGADLHLLRVGDLSEVRLDNFFARYYSRPENDKFVVPAVSGLDNAGAGCDLSIVALNGRRYLFVSAIGLLDVWEVFDGGAPPPPPPPPPPPDQLIAAFDVPSAFPQVGPVPFVDQSSGPVAIRAWSFGDGSGSIEKNPIHVYASAGTFTVTLTVSSAAGKSASTSREIVVRPNAPPPPFDKPPLAKSNCYIGDLAETAKAGEQVYMRVQSIGWKITDEIVTWNFGDGNALTSIDPLGLGAVTHAWPVAGSFVVTMSVRRGEQFLVDTKAITITGKTVEPPLPPPPPPPPPPPVEVIPNPQNTYLIVRELEAAEVKPLLPGVPIHLYVQTTGWSRSGAEVYRWDFDDGTPTSAEKEVAHVFAKPGVYDVRLTLTTDAGSGTVHLLVQIAGVVAPPPPPPAKLEVKSVRQVAANTGAPVCDQTLYAPSYLADENPVIPDAYETLLTQGDTIIKRSFPLGDPNFPWSDPNKGADRIRLSIRKPGGEWEPFIIEQYPHQRTNVVIGNHMTFPWMRLSPASEEFLAKHPESYIGATASPSHFKVGNKYHCLFTATVGDPHVTTSRLFVLYWATSPNCWQWSLRDMGRESSNIALHYAAAYFGTPEPRSHWDSALGINTVSAIYDAPYLYAMIQIQTERGQKNGLLRCKDLGTSFEIWRQGETWEPVTDGRLPSWFAFDETLGVNRNVGRGNPHAHIIAQITFAPSALSDKRYMLVASPDGKSFEVAYSDNLTEWSGTETIASKVKGLADGSGYQWQIKDPRFIGDRFIFATNDAGVLSGDASQHGATGCGTDPFHGCVIAEAKV